jgi:hypothetical protein
MSGSPFFHHPLQSLPDVSHGIHLFRGKKRDEDARKIAQRIQNTDNSVRLIEGRNGIGKTTLANRVKFLLSDKPDVAVFPEVIQIDLSRERSIETLAAEILYAAIRALAAHNKVAEREARDQIKAEGEGLVLDGIISVPERQISLAYILGISFTRNKLRQEARIRPLAEWHEALRRVAAAANSVGVKSIVVHINNLDQSTLTSPEAVGDLFGHARDLLQTRGYHFLLCANEQFRTRALKDRTNIKDIIGVPVRPAPLSQDEVAEIVHARYQDQHRLMEGQTLYEPMRPEEAALIFTYFGGELRAAFECIERVFVEELGPTGSPVQLSAQTVLEYQRPIFVDLLGTLNEAQLQVLWAVVRVSKEGKTEVRQSQVVEHLTEFDENERFSQGYVSQIAEELVNERWLTKNQPNSRATFYNLGGRTRIIIPDIRRLMSRAGLDDAQKALSEFEEAGLEPKPSGRGRKGKSRK